MEKDPARKTRSALAELLSAFWSDEEGQATTEYVMLIAVLVVALIAVGKIFREKMLGLIQSRASQLQSQFFSSGRIHKLPFSLR